MKISANFKNMLPICLLAVCGFALFFVPAERALAEIPPQPGNQAAAQANFAGTWKQNKDQSDDPRQKMQEAMGNSGESGGGGGNGNGMRRGGGGQGRGQGGMMNEFSQLTIVQTGSNVKITGATGRVLAQSADGSQASSQPSSGAGGENATAASAVQWQDNQLVVVTPGMRGGKTTRTYAFSADGKQLYVTTKMESERFKTPVTYRFVYDAVAPSGGTSK
jgi:hypothetical protein